MTTQLGWRDLLDGIKQATVETKVEYGWLTAVAFFPIGVLLAIDVWSVVQANQIDTDDSEKIEAAKERSAAIEDWSELTSD